MSPSLRSFLVLCVEVLVCCVIGFAFGALLASGF